MKERDPEAKEKPCVVHHVKAMSLRGIFLREGSLASLSIGGAKRPATEFLVGPKGFCEEQPMERGQGSSMFWEGKSALLIRDMQKLEEN